MDENLHILIRKCQENKREAQGEIYKLFSPQLFSVCLRYSNSYEDAQDTFQEGFITIFNKISQYRFQGSFEGWMRRIMVNACIEKHRNRNHLYVVNENIISSHDETEEPEAGEDAYENFSYEEILRLIQELPDRYRQVFNLYVLEEYSHQEIAEVLQISPGTSKSNLSRAREKLKEMIKKNHNIRLLSK